MKKIMLVLALISLFMITDRAFAQGEDTFYMYMVAETSAAAKTPKTTPYYDYDSPTLFAHIPSADSVIIEDVLWSYDLSPTTNFYNGMSFGNWVNNGNSQDFWINPPLDEWNKTKIDGNWTVTASYLKEDRSILFGSGATKFSLASTTTPEPISAVLFLIGGGSLAFLRRKKLGIEEKHG